jgi:hypothetical protein
MKTKLVIGTNCAAIGISSALTGLDSVHQFSGEVCG